MIITFCSELTERPEYKYARIDNRIIEDNYTDLSVEAYMVLTRCLANQSGWQMSWNHFEKKYNITNDKRLSALQELISKRHCVMDKWKTGKAWEYNYVFFEIALSEEELEEFTQKILPELRNRNLEFQNKNSKFRILKPAQYILYNNITKNNFTNNNSTKNTYGCVSAENFKNNSNTCNSMYSCEHETCDMDSPNNSTFRENLNKNNNMENFEVATNLNNSSNFVTKPSVPKVKKSHKQFQQKNDDGTVTKNKMEYQMNQESKSLSDIAVDNKGKLGKQTEEERILAETKKVNKETQEALKEIKARKSVSKNTKKRRESEIFSLIEQDFTDNLRQLMHEYFDFLIQLGRPIEAPSYRAMLRILDELSGGDDKKKEAIVNQSLARGWQGFYALKDNSNTQKTRKNVQPVLAHQEEEEPEIKEFRDENGNLITFG